MSEQLTLHQKMCRITEECGYVQKKEKVAFGNTKYSYASAEQVLSKFRESRIKYGVTLNSYVQVLHTTPDLTNVIAQVTLELSDGSLDSRGNLLTVTATGVGQGADKGDKATMKAETAAHKYAVATLLSMSWGDDPEADTSIYEEDKPKKPAKAAPESDATSVDMLRSVITLSKSLTELEKSREAVLAFQKSNPEVYKDLSNLYKAQKAKFNGASTNGN